MKNLLTIFLLIIVQFAFGQSGSIQGVVIDNETNEPLMFATVAIIQNGKLIRGVQTDFDGKYQFDSLIVGTYDIEVRYVGYEKTEVKKIKVVSSETTLMNLTLKNALDCCCIKIETRPVLINFWDLTQGTTFSADEIGRSPHKN